MSKVHFVKAVAIAAVLSGAVSVHAAKRATPLPVNAPPVQRTLDNPPLVVPPGTTPPATPVVVVNTCASKQASRC